MNRILMIGTVGNPFWLAAVLVAGLYFLVSRSFLRIPDPKPSGEWIRKSPEPEIPILPPGVRPKPAGKQG